MAKQVDGEFVPDENTVVDMVTVAVCNYLNEESPLGQLDPEAKKAIGLGIHMAIGESLAEIVEAIKSLEPIIIGVLQGPIAEKLVRAHDGDDLTTVGTEAAQIAFAAMSEGNRLIKGVRND